MDQEGLILSGCQKPDFVKSMQTGYMNKKNDLKLKLNICKQQMSAIEWSTDSFMKKLNDMCKDHIEVLKSHTLGDEQPKVQPNRGSGEESHSAFGGIPQI